MLDRFFGLSEHGTNVRTELLAGLTTFLTMAYIIFVQPAVLSGRMFGIRPEIMDFQSVTVATCVSAAVASAIMALYARYPIAQAPGMGENFFFVFSAVPAAAALVAREIAAGRLQPGEVEPWRIALGVVFISGVLFLLLSLFGVREMLMEAISPSMRNGIAVGIGLFIAFIGLQNANLVLKDPGTAVRLNCQFLSPDLIVFFFGLLLTAGLQALRVRGSVLWGIVAATLLAVGLKSVLPLLPYPAGSLKTIEEQMPGSGLGLSLETSWTTQPGSQPVVVTITPAAPLESPRKLTIELLLRRRGKVVDDAAGYDHRVAQEVTVAAGRFPAHALVSVPELADAGEYAVNVLEEGQPRLEWSRPWTAVPQLPALVTQSMLMQRFSLADRLFSPRPSMEATFLKMDLIRACHWTMIPFIVIFLFMVVFDTLGTLTGVSERAGLIRDNRLPRVRQAFMSDALGTVVGAACGTSTVTSFIESAAGVEQGGRTGLMALSTAVLFLVALFFGPIIAMVGSYPPITAPALVIIGSLMMQGVGKIDLNNFAEAIPAYLVVIGIPLTYSIADGLALGFISYPVVKLIAGQGRDVKWLMYVMAAVLVVYFVAIRAQTG